MAMATWQCQYGNGNMACYVAIVMLPFLPCHCYGTMAMLTLPQCHCHVAIDMLLCYHFNFNYHCRSIAIVVAIVVSVVSAIVVAMLQCCFIAMLRWYHVAMFS